MNSPIRHVKWKKATLIHLCIWIIYGGVELVRLSLAFGKVLTHLNSLFEVFVNLICGVLFFYTVLLFILPRNTERINVLSLICRLVLGIGLFLALRRVSFLLLVEWTDFESAVVRNLNFFFVSSFDLFTRFGIYAALIWFFRRQGALQKQVLQRQLEKEQLRSELLEAKHAILKAQINPHFLFNTLNFIHAKAVSSEDPTLDKTILLLSDILRHSLHDGQATGLIPVREELQHIRKLNELNGLRFNGKYYFDIVEEGAAYHKQIPRFILLTFFENAMKYGVYHDPKNPLLLKITQSTQLLEVYMKNKIADKDTSLQREGFAIGSRYIRNVLDQFYKNMYILTYRNEGECYIVHLKIREA